MRFIVPGIPVPKGRPRLTTINGSARAYTPKKTKDYESIVAMSATDAMQGAEPMDKPLMAHINIYLPIPASWSKKKRELALSYDVIHTKKPDVDNVLKAILDGMNGIVFVDDARVVGMYVFKHYSDTPRVDVEIEILKGQCA